MQLAPGGRKAFTRRNLLFVLLVLSPLLVWGLLIFWVSMALQQP